MRIKRLVIVLGVSLWWFFATLLLGESNFIDLETDSSFLYWLSAAALALLLSALFFLVSYAVVSWIRVLKQWLYDEAI